MKASVLGFVAIILCLAAARAEAARIKIHLARESVERYHSHVSKRQAATACSDVVPVNRTTLTLPGRLNGLNERVLFFRSEIAQQNLNSYQDITEVPLANFPRTLLREVLDVLRNNSCFPFFYGGAIRDQFLGDTPKDADVEIDCSIEMFYNVCVSTWGETNCGRSVGRPLGHIGLSNEQLMNVDLASTDITFYAPLSDLEYTANSMAFDLNGLNIVIDLTATGRVDVCNKHIRIPSEDDSVSSWEAWLAGNSGVLLRFWKLRIKDFTAFNNGTLNFITSNTITHLQENPNEFGKFYCTNAYSADFVAGERRCDTSATACESGRSKAALYNAAFAEDLGDFWANTIEPNLLPTTCGDGSDSGAWMTTYSMGVILALVMGYFLIA